jgi:hypothetical protein
VNGEAFASLLHFIILLHWKTGLVINAQVFLAGCHYNEEELSRHLKKKKRILAGPNEWQQVCNRSNPEETGRSCEGADFSWSSSKVSRTLVGLGIASLSTNYAPKNLPGH